MVIQHGEQFLIINVSQGSARLILAQKTKVSEQLAKPNFGRELKQLGQNG